MGGALGTNGACVGIYLKGTNWTSMGKLGHTGHVLYGVHALKKNCSVTYQHLELRGPLLDPSSVSSLSPVGSQTREDASALELPCLWW